MVYAAMKVAFRKSTTELLFPSRLQGWHPKINERPQMQIQMVNEPPVPVAIPDRTFRACGYMGCVMVFSYILPVEPHEP